MYQRPKHSNRVNQTVHAAGSFYYDYTEAFETERIQKMDTAAPLCPIPQRVGSFPRPMVLRDDDESGTDATGIRIEQDDGGKEHKHGESLNFNCREVEISLGSGYALGQVEAAETSTLAYKNMNAPEFSAVNGKYEATTRNVSLRSPRSLSSALTGVEADVLADQIRRENSSSAPPGPMGRGELRLTTGLLQTSVTASKTPKSSSLRGSLHETRSLGPDARVTGRIGLQSSRTSANGGYNNSDPNLPGFASLIASFDQLSKSPFSKRGTDFSLNLDALGR